MTMTTINWDWWFRKPSLVAAVYYSLRQEWRQEWRWEPESHC